MSDQKITSEHRTSRRNPCRICEGTSWCCNFEDRTLCMKIASDRPAKEEGWWHPLPGCEWPEYRRDEVAVMPERPVPTERAGLARRNQVYTDLLSYISLSKDHAEHLQGPKRQLSRSQIDLRQYRTLWHYEHNAQTQELYAFKIAAELQSKYGDLHKVPGFGNRDKFSNKPGETIAGALCLTPRVMIPVRSVEGLIEGFQLMDPEPADEDTPKYIWFSGVGDDGAGIGKPLHVSRPVCTSHKPEKNVDIVITEGPLKADIISDQVGITTVAFQGVKCIDWAAMERTIEVLEPRRILLALDADRHRNEHVAKAHEELCRWCEEHGHAYMVADWAEEDGKGLDDLLLSGGKPTWLEPRPKEAEPEKRERIEIERYALASSWSQPATARELTKFPNSAWESNLHRACVDAVRRLLREGEDLNYRAIRRLIKIHTPELLPAWKDLEAWYIRNQTGLAGLHRTALAEFREDVNRTDMAAWLTQQAENLHSMAFEDFYEAAHRGFTSLAPGSDETHVVESLETIMLRRAEQHQSSEGTPEIIIPTGIAQLDKALGGGFKQGWKVLLVGKPGSGKTTLAEQIASNASSEGHESYFLSLEMRKRTLGDRAIARAAQKALKSKYTETDWTTVRNYAHHFRNVMVDDLPVKIDEFRTRVDNWLYKNPKTAMVWIDYAGRVKERKKGQNTTDAASDVADAWADSADRHDKCHVLLQQPTKEYDREGRPDTAFIRDSAVFFQHADVILWIHKPCQFKGSPTQRKDFAEIYLMKHREGKTCQVPVKVRNDCFTVQDWVGPLPWKAKKKKSDEPEESADDQADAVELDGIWK